MRDIITKLEQLNVEKEQLNEGLADMAHEAEKDHEVQMARSDCYKSAKYAVAIHKMLKDVSEMEGIDGWVAAKITKAADYLGSVKHYMEGQAMSDVELAVVPVAGDMTDAMTLPQESINEGFGPPSNGAKNIQELISKMGADTPGDIIADIMHWADANDMEFSDLVRQGTMYYNDEKMMYNDDGDDEDVESESVGESVRKPEMSRLQKLAQQGNQPAFDELNDEERMAALKHSKDDAQKFDTIDMAMMKKSKKNEEEMQEEDIIGDLIAKLPRTTKQGYSQTDRDLMNKLIAKVDSKTPIKPKAPATPAAKMSPVTQQKQANAAAKMQTQSKFSEWSKK